MGLVALEEAVGITAEIYMYIGFHRLYITCSQKLIAYCIQNEVGAQGGGCKTTFFVLVAV